MRITDLPASVRSEIEGLAARLEGVVLETLEESANLPEFVDRLDMLMHYYDLDGDRLRDGVIGPLRRIVSGA